MWPFDAIVAWIVASLAPYTAMPQSTLITMGVAAGLSLISCFLSWWLVDYEMIRTSMREVQAWQRALTAAMKAKDEPTIAKLNLKKQAMMKMQGKSSFEQLKVSAITLAPFFIIWYLLNMTFGGHVVAVAPFPILFFGPQMSFVAWYIICSFAINLPMMRLFKIGLNET